MEHEGTGTTASCEAENSLESLQHGAQQDLDPSLCQTIDGELGDMETLSAVRDLIAKGANPNAFYGVYHEHALGCAIRRSKQQTAMELVAAGANISLLARKRTQSPPALEQALSAGMLDLARMIAPLTDLEQRNWMGELPWMRGLSAISNAEELAPFLPSRPPCQEDLDQALLIAMEGSPLLAERAVAMLIPMGASPSSSNSEGFSALMQAINHDGEGAALALIDAGANLAARDVPGDTAFSWAAIRGSEPLLRCLAPFSNVDQRHVDGRTPLMQAIEYHSVNENTEDALVFLLSMSNLEARVDKKTTMPAGVEEAGEMISLWEFAKAMAPCSRVLELVRGALDAKAAREEALDIAASTPSSPAPIRGKVKFL